LKAAAAAAAAVERLQISFPYDIQHRQQLPLEQYVEQGEGASFVLCAE
jgi:hypothetical protein